MVEVAFNIVQQAVHQRQTTGAGHQFEADKRAVDLEILRVAIKVVQIVSLRLNVAVGFNQKPAVPAAGSCTTSRGCGFSR